MTSISNVAVVGSGQMGLGIAENLAQAGFFVQIHKMTNTGELIAVRDKFINGLQKRVERGKLIREDFDKITANVTFHGYLVGIDSCQLVIESVVENFSIKKNTLKTIEDFVHYDTIIASNTSSLPLSSLACKLERPQNFVGLHFFNPANVMKLVEIGVTQQTHLDVVETCKTVCVRLGKTSVEVKASPGYVVNRLLLPYLLQSIETLEGSLTDAQSIDTAMQLGCGHPMGPLSLADFIGLDTVESMAKYLLHELQDKRYRIPSLLRLLVSRGEFGKKSGKGIFDYSVKPPKINSTVTNALQPK